MHAPTHQDEEHEAGGQGRGEAARGGGDGNSRGEHEGADVLAEVRADGADGLGGGEAREVGHVGRGHVVLIRVGEAVGDGGGDGGDGGEEPEGQRALVLPAWRGGGGVGSL